MRVGQMANDGDDWQGWMPVHAGQAATPTSVHDAQLQALIARTIVTAALAELPGAGPGAVSVLRQWLSPGLVL